MLLNCLGVLNIACKVLNQQQVGRKFNLQIRDTSSTPNSRTNTNNTSNASATNNCINRPDYFSSSANKEEGKEASGILAKIIHNDDSDVLQGVECFEGMFKLQVRGQQPYFKLFPEG